MKAPDPYMRCRMFNKDNLRDLAETILYVNLLLAILALIALYDQRAVNDADDAKENSWHERVDEKLEELALRIKALEEMAQTNEAENNLTS